MDIGIGLLQEFPPAELRAIVGLCEELGYTTLWYGSEKFYRDSYIGLAIASMSSQKMRLGTYIADPYTQNPALLAVAIATLDELSGGRAVQLLGAGGSGLFRMGMHREHPVRAIRETLSIVRRLLNGETVTHESEMFHLKNVRLGFAARADIPLYVASRGDLMLTMAGEHADGVMIATHATPRGVRHALDRVDAGARKKNRQWQNLFTINRADGWIDGDRERARAAVRPAIARLLGASYPDRSFVNAAGLQVPPELESILSHRNRDEATAAAHMVPEEFVDAFAWAGTPAEVALKIAAIVDLGINGVTFMPNPPKGAKVEAGVRAFAQEVMPRVRALLGK